MSTALEQQHLAGPKASSSVDSHCGPLPPVHIPILRRPSLTHMAVSPQHTWAALIPASVPYGNVCPRVDFLLCQSVITLMLSEEWGSNSYWHTSHLRKLMIWDSESLG